LLILKIKAEPYAMFLFFKEIEVKKPNYKGHFVI